ncbi:MAG: NAD-dependent epimerase/dehydratase family protein [Candidatus Rokubacteria bacterium]|nr:NAD-dependent epimerase/dehydratase family protein [Candidatus Rokubacteria bacterium]
MRVLVMGGTEFVSLHLVRALVRDGHAVTVFNRGRQSHRLPAGVELIAGDRKGHAGLATALAGRAFDAVCDVTYAPTTGEDVAALADAVAQNQPHVIFMSSGRVYDHALPIPYDEDTPRGEYWGDYARHKTAGEDALLERHRATGLPVTIVRPTHVLGPLNTRYNETFFFDRILRGRPILVPGHGGWLRQFGHVEDLADAIAAMLGNPKSFGQAYNVTGEEIVTQLGFVEVIAEVLERPLELTPFDPALFKELDFKGPVFGQNLVYDCHAVYTTWKLRRELGLRPRYTLASGLRQTFEWYLKEGLERRPVDFSLEDRLRARLGP